MQAPVTLEDLVKRGRCVGSASPELFFPSESGPASGLEAKRICARCVVKAECLRFALVTDQRWGVWGGTSAYERRRLSRELVAAGVVAWIAGQGEA